MEAVLADWPAVSLSRDTAWYLRRGQPVRVPHGRRPTAGSGSTPTATGSWASGEVLDDGRVAPRRLIGG